MIIVKKILACLMCLLHVSAYAMVIDDSVKPDQGMPAPVEQRNVQAASISDIQPVGIAQTMPAELSMQDQAAGGSVFDGYAAGSEGTVQQAEPVVLGSSTVMPEGPVSGESSENQAVSYMSEDVQQVSENNTVLPVETQPASTTSGSGAEVNYFARQAFGQQMQQNTYGGSSYNNAVLSAGSATSMGSMTEGDQSEATDVVQGSDMTVEADEVDDMVNLAAIGSAVAAGAVGLTLIGAKRKKVKALYGALRAKIDPKYAYAAEDKKIRDMDEKLKDSKLSDDEKKKLEADKKKAEDKREAIKKGNPKRIPQNFDEQLTKKADERKRKGTKTTVGLADAPDVKKGTQVVDTRATIDRDTTAKATRDSISMRELPAPGDAGYDDRRTSTRPAPLPSQIQDPKLNIPPPLTGADSKASSLPPSLAQAQDPQSQALKNQGAEAKGRFAGRAAMAQQQDGQSRTQVISGSGTGSTSVVSRLTGSTSGTVSGVSATSTGATPKSEPTPKSSGSLGFMQTQLNKFKSSGIGQKAASASSAVSTLSSTEKTNKALSDKFSSSKLGKQVTKIKTNVSTRVSEGLRNLAKMPKMPGR